VRLGVLGGSFDPVHLGHLRAAESARESLQLDEVLFVPAGQPPHKGGTHASGRERFAMVCLATASHPGFAVSALELDRSGPSYTVDTLLELRAERPEAELYLIVGSDTVPEVAGWRSAERLRELATLAVVTRPGQAPPAPAVEPPGARVALARGPGLEVSSSEVRQRLRAGLSVRYLVPDGVHDYLVKRRLYR
jgi:nicotinate-nucleotide adenylyltransferase